MVGKKKHTRIASPASTSILCEIKLKNVCRVRMRARVGGREEGEVEWGRGRIGVERAREKDGGWVGKVGVGRSEGGKESKWTKGRVKVTYSPPLHICASIFSLYGGCNKE